jgi:integrase
MRVSAGSLYRRRGSPFWWMKFYLNGKPVRETTEETSERAAGKALRKRITALEAGQASIEFRGLRVADLVPLIERDYADRQQRSWARVEYAWRCHLEPFFAQRRIEELGSDDRDDYVDKRQDEEASNSTISRELSYLNRMLELGRQTTPRKVTNPFKFKRLTEGNPRQGFVTPEQLQKFTKACHISKNSSRDQRHYAALAILGYHLGWRSKELRDIKVRQVEPETKSIRLYRSQSKNKAGRLMKLPAECWEIVARYMQGKNPDDYLITRSNGFPILSMKDGWREIAKRAGLPGMLFHDLRRTAARNMLRTGVSASVVMEILGWKSFAMLQRYDIVSEADLAIAAEKLDEVKGDGHNLGHTELFEGLSGIQNWKPKYK